MMLPAYSCADIPVRPLDTVGIAGQIDGLAPAYGLRSHPTGEVFGFDTLRAILPAERSKQNSPFLVIQFRHVGEIAAPLHHRYHSDVWTGEQGQ